MSNLKLKTFITLALILTSTFSYANVYEIFSEGVDVFQSMFSKSGVKIRFTGTIKEPIVMKNEKTGETYTITSLPFEFKCKKENLPAVISFTSDNYTYQTITIPRKPVNDTGHYYVLKTEGKRDKTKEGTAPSLEQIQQQTQQLQAQLQLQQALQQLQQTQQQLQQTQQQYAAVPQQYAQQPVATQPTGSEQMALDKSLDVNNAPKTDKCSDNTFALIIANEEYTSAAKVDMATYDGLAMKEYCINTLGLAENQVVYAPNASFGEMKKAIGKIKMIANAFDKNMNLIFYYAGHGIPDNATQDAYLMPVDADGTDVSVCYSLKSLYSEFESMNINQTIAFLDACFSGAKRDGDMIVAARGVAIKPKKEAPIGKTIVFSATSDEEAAHSYKEKKHGMFTYFLLKKLNEMKGDVSLGELAKYISTNVKRNSVLVNGVVQTPTVIAPKALAETWQDMKLTGN